MILFCSINAQDVKEDLYVVGFTCKAYSQDRRNGHFADLTFSEHTNQTTILFDSKQ